MKYLFVIFVISVTIFKTFKCDSSEITPSPFYCPDRRPQNSISIPDIMGMWYGSEIITHQDDRDNRTGTFYYDTCVVIHLADITDQMTTTTISPHRSYHNYARTPDQNLQTRYLRLIWDETNANVEYILRYNNSRRGFWISSAPQTGTMLDLNLPYSHFYGTIQVMKAVGDHLVLTFCTNMPQSQQYSVILSRKPSSLSNEDLGSIRDLLRRRNLPMLAIRRVCFSNAITKSFSSLLIFLTIFLIKI